MGLIITLCFRQAHVSTPESQASSQDDLSSASGLWQSCMPLRLHRCPSHRTSRVFSQRMDARDVVTVVCAPRISEGIVGWKSQDVAGDGSVHSRAICDGTSVPTCCKFPRRRCSKMPRVRAAARCQCRSAAVPQSGPGVPYKKACVSACDSVPQLVLSGGSRAPGRASPPASALAPAARRPAARSAPSSASGLCMTPVPYETVALRARWRGDLNMMVRKSTEAVRSVAARCQSYGQDKAAPITFKTEPGHRLWLTGRRRASG